MTSAPWRGGAGTPLTQDEMCQAPREQCASEAKRRWIGTARRVWARSRDVCERITAIQGHGPEGVGCPTRRVCTDFSTAVNNGEFLSGARLFV